MNLQNRVIHSVLLLIAVAVVARVAWWLLEPLLAPLALIAIVGSLLLWVIRGPHAR